MLPKTLFLVFHELLVCEQKQLAWIIQDCNISVSQEIITKNVRRLMVFPTAFGYAS